MGSNKLFFYRRNGLAKVIISFILIFSTLVVVSYAASWIVNNQSLFGQGNYTNVEWNSTGFVQLTDNDTKQQFPDYGVSDEFINMSGNVLLYHFEEASGNITDYGGGYLGLDLIPTGVSYQQTGQLNYGVNIDVVGEVAETADYTPDLTNGLSVETWVYFTGPTIGRVAIVSHKSPGCWAIGTVNSQPAAWRNCVASHWKGGTGGTITNAWHHIAAVWYPNNSLFLYRDSVQVYTGNSIGPTAGTSAVTLSNFSVGNVQSFQGTVDEVAIWNRSLSAEEISNHYNRQKERYINEGSYTSKIFDAGGPSLWNNISWEYGPVFNYSLTGQNLPDDGSVENFSYGANMTGNLLLVHMDDNVDGAANRINDTSGNEYNGTTFYNVNCTKDSPIGNNSCYFDGTNDYIDHGSHSDNLDPLSGNYSLEAWVNPYDTGNLRCIAGKLYYGGSTDEYGLYTNSGYFYYKICDGSSCVNEYSDETYTINKWYHVVTTRNGSTNRLYVDGVEQGDAQTLGGDVNSNYNFYISGRAQSPSTYNWYGLIDEVAYYNRTLSPDEILSHYKRGVNKTLNFTVRSCDDENCDGENWIDINDSPTQTLSVDENRYFQYKTYFYKDEPFQFSDYTLTNFNKLYNVTVDYTLTARTYWVRTYTITDEMNMQLPVNHTMKIKAYANSIYTPNISINLPNGTMVVNEAAMTNETVVTANTSTWYYNFTPNNTGWYDVTVSGRTYNDLFYVGNIWQEDWLDHQSNAYPFRIELNVSESGNILREWQPVDINVNFTYKTHNNSVRVVFSNGTHLTEIPSQLYNRTYSDGYTQTANLVFLTSMVANDNRTFYVYYSRSNLNETNYTTDLSMTNVSNFYQVNNSNYEIKINESRGGVIQEVYNKNGDNQNLAGLNPIQTSPIVTKTPYTYTASDLTTPTKTVTNGTVFSMIQSTGQVGTMDYDLTYKFYPKLNYFIVESNVTPMASETWSYYKDQQFFLGQGFFSKVTTMNSSGIMEYDIVNGDGTDVTNLGNLSWLGFYNSDSRNSLGTIFLETHHTSSYTPNSAFYDNNDNEYYERTFYAGSVSTSDYFYSKNAILIWNSLNEDDLVNETYYQLINPVSTSLGSSQTNDTIDPQYFNTGYTPATVNDTSSVTCYGYFTDNLEIDYVSVNVSSRGYNNVTIYQLNSNESWVNHTIDASDLEAGPTDCKFTVYDIAARSNETNFTFDVTDLTPPYFTYVNNSPYTSAGLDPDVQINISANLTEYNNISTARLQYRKNSSCSWTNQTLTRYSVDGYVSVYNGSFTPDEEDIWQYRIATSDNQGNGNSSVIQNLSIAYDWTWIHTPATISAVSGLLGENITVGNITINNTGDKDLFFKITSNWEDKTKIFFNASQENSIGYNFTLASGNNTTIPVNVTGKTTERSDSLTITINPQNSSASPSSNTTSTTIVSYAGGPFLLVTITQYNLSVIQGDSSIDLQAKVQNKGNETATNTWLAFSLPSGWIVNSGTLNSTVGNLTVDEIAYSSLIVSVESDATTGTQTLTALSGCLENKTGSDSVSVAVNEYSSSTTEITETTSGGGGAAGGMGGGASASQRAKLFQTEETYEIVRGEDQSFILKVENPYEGVLENVTVTVAGFLEQYLRIEPLVVNLIPQNDSYEFIIYIEAPDYFTKGIYDLNFTINGIIKKPVLVENKTQYIKTTLKESRIITLEVHEVSKEEAMSYINLSLDLIADMESLELYTLDLEYLREDLLDYLEDKDYESARDIYNQILDLKEKAFSTLDLLEEVESNINLSIYNGIDVSKTQRLALLARAALARGDYSTALQRADDAKITYALETAGKFNVVAYVKNNFFQVTGSLILIIIFSYLSYLTIKLKVIQYKIKQYRDEESVILGLIRETQRECFEKRKMSMKEYTESLMQYENRMSKIVKESIKLETIKINLFKLFKGKKKRFLEEKDRVLNLIKETQILYMKGGNIETSIYKNRMKSYTERLAELEENLANIEAREAMGKIDRRNFFKFNWLK